MDKIQRLGGVAALLEALIYVLAFVFFGAYWNFPGDGNAVQQFAYLREHHAALAIATFIMYVVFGIILVALVMALEIRLKDSPLLSKAASLFGYLWVGLVITSGMVANIGLASAIELSAKDPEQALTLWRANLTVVEGIGGGNEIVGGLWVLLLSIAAQRLSALPKALNYYGMLVGIAGIITVYPAEISTVLFGLSQIGWFVWLGSRMLRKR